MKLEKGFCLFPQALGFLTNYHMRIKMKKFAATLCIAGSVLALAACESVGSGNVETAPPYSTERTAGSTDAPVRAAQTERTFRATQSK